MTTRADDNGPFKEFVFEDWLREGLTALRNEVKNCRKEFTPANFRKRLRQASKEQLLAMRKSIDNVIELIDKQEAGNHS